MTVHAKREPLLQATGQATGTPHLDFYLKHTVKARTPSLTGRVWTD
ncbi:MAG: hypothetical protein PHI63_06690 [Patescibacteria group bacterium]|nr:hypothetical protein [Patescibacteria group bacterium]